MHIFFVSMAIFISGYILGNVTGSGEATFNVLKMCEEEKAVIIQGKKVECHVR